MIADCAPGRKRAPGERRQPAPAASPWSLPDNIGSNIDPERRSGRLSARIAPAQPTPPSGQRDVRLAFLPHLPRSDLHRLLVRAHVADAEDAPARPELSLLRRL